MPRSLNRRETKPKAIVTCPHAFTRAWHRGLRLHYLLRVLIGSLRCLRLFLIEFQNPFPADSFRCIYIVSAQPRSQGLSLGREEERPWERGCVSADVDKIQKSANKKRDLSLQSLFFFWYFAVYIGDNVNSQFPFLYPLRTSVVSGQTNLVIRHSI